MAGLDETVLALGERIRALRKAQGLTLTQLAASSDLSHSFLSQVERGRERLSMASLFRIAAALGTTQQALLVDDARDTSEARHYVFAHDAASPLDAGGGPALVLAQGDAPFVPMLINGTFSGMGEDDGWFIHPEAEFVLVLEGELIVDLDDKEYRLRAGDSTYYEGGVRHRWRTDDGASCRLLSVKERAHR
ncbi:MAG: helix-turn-helix domain-containing protein [Microbacterium sp.]